MAMPLLKTKLYIPPPHADLVSRPRLIERLDEGLRPGCKLILLSAPAGFGKTTLLSEWIRAGVGTLRGEYGVGKEHDLAEGGAPTPYSILRTSYSFFCLGFAGQR